MSNKLKYPMEMTKAELFCTVFLGLSYLVLISSVGIMMASLFDNRPETVVDLYTGWAISISLFFYLVTPRVREND